jgi:hypothetical protein
VIPALVVIFGLAAVIMLAIIIEARSARLPEEVLLPVEEQDIRWVAPAPGDARVAPDARSAPDSAVDGR